MSAMRIIVVIACLSAVPAAQAAEAPNTNDQSTASASLLARLVPVVHPSSARKPLASRLKPHDRAHVVVRVARAEAHEPGSTGVVRAKLVADETRLPPVQRVAVLDRTSTSCDLILCPGYAILGVGF